jgi:transcriptional regulator with XRE-family HTH domain
MKFSEKIVKLRKMKGLTQDEFASAVGVSRQAVYKWESGQSYPEVAKLVEMKLLFNISIDDLLDESYEVVVPEKKKVRATRQTKEKVEKTVREEVLATAPAVEEEATATEETVAEPVTEPVAETVAEAANETVAEKEESEKKVGFFGRLFGRR